MNDLVSRFLMPNLLVGHELIAGEMSIVSVDHEYAKQFPDFRRFVRKFTDPFGDSVTALDCHRKSCQLAPAKMPTKGRPFSCRLEASRPLSE